MAKEFINMVQMYERNEKQLTAKQLYEIQQAEIRHERALKRKRREERIARAKRAEREVAKHRVNTRYFKNLVQNNLMVKVKTDQYGNVQRG
jgi:phage terminase large subunit GpA-like protein